jgi:alpha-glucosidase
VLQLHSTDQPEVHDIAAEMRTHRRRVWRARADRRDLSAGAERLMRYYGVDAPGVHLPFNFQLIGALERAARSPHDRRLRSGAARRRLAELGARQSRSPARRRQTRRAQARVAAMLLLTLRGTPTLYYGDELGMEDVAIPAAKVQDPRELASRASAWAAIRCARRWPGMRMRQCRFQPAEPWLPLHADWPTRNVGQQQTDLGSM